MLMSNTWHKNAVALSGIFASGKSTVCSLFEQMGAFIVDADALARQVVAPKSQGQVEIIKEFGKEKKRLIL